MYRAREQLLRVRYLLGLVRRREKLKRHAEEISQVRGHGLVVGG